MRILLGTFVCLLFVQAPALAQGMDARARARQHYESGVSLFESGNKEQALVEFQLANELAPKPENGFMIAQCEYHLGKLVDARAHYQAYLDQQPQGDLADLARLRIAAINRRPGVFAINTVPDDVDVRIEGQGQVFTGQAPNDFLVPHGHYRVTVSKPKFSSESRELSIEVAETKPLFFKLEPIPAHLSIHTQPAGAALFVRGNRTRNPYVQDVPPGTYEIYAEAQYYQSKRETITLSPGETRDIEFPLTYVQRSGRPELIGFWTVLGAIGGGLAVLTQTEPGSSSAPLGTVFGAGILAGGMTFGFLSSTTRLVPDYIRDNLALFRIGTTWVGGVEGATLAMGLSQSWTPTLLGSAGGVAVGAFTGWWLDNKAPNYGRVALLQSAALIGMAAGAVFVPAAGWYPTDPGPDGTPTDKATYQNQSRERLAWGMLAGLNVGLIAGLGMAYLPDQRAYGPTWQRVLMVDLAGLAGGIIASAVEYCSRRQGNDPTYCATSSAGSGNTPTTSNRLNAKTARFALVGTGIGLIAGWILTSNFDKPTQSHQSRPPLSLWLPLPGAVPVQTKTGTAEIVPGLVSQGQF